MDILYRGVSVSQDVCVSVYTMQGASASINQDVCVFVCACHPILRRRHFYKSRCLCVCARHPTLGKGGLSLQIEMSVCESETNWRFIKMCWNLKGNNGAPLGAVIWKRYLYL